LAQEDFSRILILQVQLAHDMGPDASISQVSPPLPGIRPFVVSDPGCFCWPRIMIEYKELGPSTDIGAPTSQARVLESVDIMTKQLVW